MTRRRNLVGLCSIAAALLVVSPAPADAKHGQRTRQWIKAGWKRHNEAVRPIVRGAIGIGRLKVGICPRVDRGSRQVVVGIAPDVDAPRSLAVGLFPIARGQGSSALGIGAIGDRHGLGLALGVGAKGHATGAFAFAGENALGVVTGQGGLQDGRGKARRKNTFSTGLLYSESDNALGGLVAKGQRSGHALGAAVASTGDARALAFGMGNRTGLGLLGASGKVAVAPLGEAAYTKRGWGLVNALKKVIRKIP